MTENNTLAALLLGDPDDTGGATRVEQITLPSPLQPAHVTAALAKAGITAADFRTRVEAVTTGFASPYDAVIFSATIYGFSGRFIPVRIEDDEINPLTGEIPALEKPESVPEEITFTNPEELSAEGVNLIFTKRSVLDLNNTTDVDATSMLFTAAHVRKRDHHERFPDIIWGEDRIRLEEVRAEGAASREEGRASTKRSTVEAAEPSPRHKRLQRASEAPIADVMRRLGTSSDETGEKWHCPRPWRHSNGDRNPSMRIVDGRTRCYRCDPEWVDSLRLVMDALNHTPDEAAVWIESGDSFPALRDANGNLNFEGRELT